MTSLVLLLLVLLMPSSVWPYSYWYYGGTQTITPKSGKGPFEVELRNKQTTYSCYVNPYRCAYGNCGYAIESASSKIAWESYGLPWCQKETKTTLRLNSNLPFEIRYPTSIFYHRIGYWINDYRGRYGLWRMMAHIDLGIRSDTKESNRPPVSTMLPILRVTRNCPRWINLTTFDPDGDRVRCRVATSYSNYECGRCGLPPGFSLDQDSCSLKYTPAGRSGNMPIELVVEDFPNQTIQLVYSDRSYTFKQPLILPRRKRQINFWTTAGTTNFDSWIEDFRSTSTEVPTTTTEETTTTTEETTTSTEMPTTTTEETTTTTEVPTTSTEMPTTTTEETTTTTGVYTVTDLPEAVRFELLQGITSSNFVQLQRYRSSIPPLSKLPLQFTVLVDSHSAPSCNDGEYFPVFVSPTPANGVHLPAFVNKTLEITVKAQALYSSIYKLLVTGPSGILSHTISQGDYLIQWTPTDNELNEHFPICFIAEAYVRSGLVYHSELRCVTIDVEHYEAIVTCNETTMTVEVEKTYLIRLTENKLHLRSSITSECSLSTLSNSTHLVATMSLESCGTYVEEDQDQILYKNEISIVEQNHMISRRSGIEIAFCCAYPKRTNLTVGYKHKNPYVFKEKGFSSFTFQFEFFQSQLFRNQVAANTYPVEVYLNQMMFMQIEATSSIPNLELFVESCKATPQDDPNSHHTYSIIENGCVKDTTVQIYHSSKSQFRFGMAAFEFIGANPEVYITCSVLLCEIGKTGTRCSKGCIPSGSSRKKREVASQTSSHMISQGPLRLARALDSTTERSASFLNLNMGLNVALVVGFLLVVGVVVYRSRRSRAKYQPLPTSDSDTQ